MTEGYLLWTTITNHVILHNSSSPFLSFTTLPFLLADRRRKEVDLDPGVYTEVDQSQFQMCQWNRCCLLSVTAWVQQPKSSSQNHLCSPSGNCSSHAPEMPKALSAHIHYIHIRFICIIPIIVQNHAYSPLWFNWPSPKPLSSCNIFYNAFY